MKVLCIFPVGGRYQGNRGDITERFAKFIQPKLMQLGANNVSFSCPPAPENYPTIKTETNSLNSKTPKGQLIRACIQGLSEKPDVVIMCDGSGKISYEKVVDVFQELTSGVDMCCVMSNRVGDKCISESRYLVERFEVSVIAKINNHHKIIPDGQCGLWGFRCGKIQNNGDEKEIYINAQGYEIELDLLDEVLSKNLQYSFLDVELKPLEPIKTDFSDEEHMKKMDFFLRKKSTVDLKRLVPTYIEEFQDSEEFKKLCNKPVIVEDWKKYKDNLHNLIQQFNLPA